MPKLVCEDCGEVIEDGVDIDGGGGGGNAPGGDDIDVDPDLLPDSPDSHGHDGDDAPDDQDDDGDQGDALDDAVADLADRDDKRSSKDHFDVDDDVDVTDVGDDMKRRYRMLQDRLDDPIKDRREQRERKHYDIHTTGSKVMADLRDSGLDREIEDAFRQFTSRDVSRPARHGPRVHVRNALRREAGDWTEDRLYEAQTPVELGDRAVAVAFDVSYSMGKFANAPDLDGTERIHEAKVALAALARATDVIGDDFMASGFTTEHHDDARKGDVLTPLITAPGEAFDPEHLDTVYPQGCTPIGHGIQDASALLRAANARDKVLVVVTDADSNGLIDLNRNINRPLADPRGLVNEARDRGWTVVGFGVGGASDYVMSNIFGAEGYIQTDTASLAEDLIEVYRKQITGA